MFRVLVPVDESEDRAETAADIVESLPGDPEAIEAVLLNVFEEFEVHDEGATVDSGDIYDEEAFPDSVGRIEDRLAAAGITVRKRREHGEPAEEIADVADELDVDRIVMSGRNRRPTGKVLFGSVTQSVLLDVDRPVTVLASD
jgi:nucleotide-binding universal stress UspA family protein